MGKAGHAHEPEDPLEETGAVLESMEGFGTVGVTVIDRY